MKDELEALGVYGAVLPWRSSDALPLYNDEFARVFTPSADEVETCMKCPLPECIDCLRRQNTPIYLIKSCYGGIFYAGDEMFRGDQIGLFDD